MNYKKQRHQTLYGFGAVVGVTVQLRQISAATKQVVSETEPAKNLVMDGGLNALARSTNATYPAEFTTACRVGDGSTADKVASGAVTFTQAGTTVTASAGFFTAGMVGWIFKYGTGTAGAEYYITAFTSTTEVTVDTSATVAVPEVATVWNVTRTALVNLLFSSATYETTAGSCQSTGAANVRSHKRTYNFAQQVSSYNVNEVGYFRALAGTTIFGRIVLAATEVVAPTNFLQVVLTVTVTYSPGVPAAVADVGTNIDTTGDAMLESLNTSGSIASVASNGGVTVPTAGASADGSANCIIRGRIGAYSQNATTDAATLSWGNSGTGYYNFGAGVNWVFASSRGKMTLSCNTTITTAGESMHGVGIGFNTTPLSVTFDVHFDTPFTLPTGSFLPQVVLSCTYNRTLNN